MVQRLNNFLLSEPLTACCQECGEEYDIRRLTQAGFSTCMDCGEIQARQVIHCTVPMPKSSYVVITNKADLLHLNQKPR